MTGVPADLIRKARRSIKSAFVLAGDGDYDAAVSRAYYAMFYAATALLMSKGLEYSKHSATIAAYGREFSKRGLLAPEFHSYLRDAAERRHTADYDAAASHTKDDAERHIRRATEFVGAAEEFLDKPS